MFAAGKCSISVWNFTAVWMYCSAVVVVVVVDIDGASACIQKTYPSTDVCKEIFLYYCPKYSCIPVQISPKVKHIVCCSNVIQQKLSRKIIHNFFWVILLANRHTERSCWRKRHVLINFLTEVANITVIMWYYVPSDVMFCIWQPPVAPGL